jgi:S-adenosylmethionine:tRNA ribosyltransferase-isomerase
MSPVEARSASSVAPSSTARGVDADELLASYQFELPSDAIAQQPCAGRDGSRLLHCSRSGGRVAHRNFTQLAEVLEAGDLLIVNDTRVLSARLSARREGSGGRVEVLLVEPLADGCWAALVRPSARLRPGARVVLEQRGTEGRASGPVLVIGAQRGDGSREVRCEQGELGEIAARWGEPPLPPYIDRSDGPRAEDSERYQTIFAREPGAVAAPTAGLHFSPQGVAELTRCGVEIAPVTLHVGPGTFQPVRSQRLDAHSMHSERYRVPAETSRRIAECEARRGRVIAVGTTACRSLESWHRLGRPADGGWRTTDLFLRPGHGATMDLALLTNFHLPASTLIVLVASFIGREQTLHLYRQAAEEGYRFYSYGDAMLIL